MAEARGLGLVGAPNARELGGLPTTDGRRVRSGVLVRSSSLERLADSDLPVLAELKLSCVVDLRHDWELAVAPAVPLPEPGPRVVRAPVHDDRHLVFSYVQALLRGGDLSGYDELVTKGSAAAMEAIYRWFVTGAQATASFAAACRILADPAHVPGLFHCGAGKDRTGWLAVILLTALGVEPEAIRADYLHTNQASARSRARLLALIAERRPDADVPAIEPILLARPTYLDAAYAEVQRIYGSFDDYLRTGLQLDDQTLSSLRTRLLE